MSDEQLKTSISQGHGSAFEACGFNGGDRCVGRARLKSELSFTCTLNPTRVRLHMTKAIENSPVFPGCGPPGKS